MPDLTPPPGTINICRDSLEAIAHALHGEIDLPGAEGGWATLTVITRGTDATFSAWVNPAPGFRAAVERVVGEVDWTMPEAHR